MNFEEILYKRRTIRRFKQDPIKVEILKKLVDYARIAPMASNIQALEFIIVENSEERKKMFPLVRWASSLPEEQRTPETGREPTAYIIVLVNTSAKRLPIKAFFSQRDCKALTNVQVVKRILTFRLLGFDL